MHHFNGNQQLSLFLPALALLLSLIWHSETHAESLLIRNVTVINPGTRPPLPHRDVFIQEGKIQAITPAAQGRKIPKGLNVINGTGRFLIPGLIDSHVHLGDIPGVASEAPNDPRSPPVDIVNEAWNQLPRSYLYHGFTTLLDLISSEEKISRWRALGTTPDTYYCMGVAIPGGYPLAFLPPDIQSNHPMADFILLEPEHLNSVPKGFDLSRFKIEEQSPAAIVKKIKQAGGKCVKTFYESGFGKLTNLPQPSEKAVIALRKAAHANGVKLMLHANSQAGYEFAMATKPDVVVHGLWNWGDLRIQNAEAEKKFYQRISKAGFAVQPTIQVLEGEREILNTHWLENPDVIKVIPARLRKWYQSPVGQWMRDEMANNLNVANHHHPYEHATQAYKKPVSHVYSMAKALADNGTPIIFGSDTPSGPFFTQFPGLNGYREILSLHQAGLSLAQLLSALTIDNAHILEMQDEIGSVDVGKKANLLLLEANPLEDVTAYNRIVFVVLGGKTLPRETLAAE